MPYQINWHKQSRVLYVKLFGVLTDEESTEVSNINTKHLNEGTAPVHIIADVNELEKFPTNLRETSAFMQYLRNPSLGWVVVVGLSNNVLARFIVSVVSQVIRFHVTQRESIEEAMAFLEKQDATLVTSNSSSSPAT